MTTLHPALHVAGLALALASGCDDSDLTTTTTPETSEAGADTRYGVGTRAYEWTDPDRAEELTPEEGDLRTLVVRAWYPADAASSDERAPYFLNPIQAQLNAEFFGLPADAFDAFELPAALDAPPVAGRFPVLIFSPGLSTLPDYYGYQLAELASHGYVILALSHPYAMGPVVFADGRIAPEVPAASDPDLRDPAIATWSLDQRFVLSRLERLGADDPSDPLVSHLDLGRVGVFGHSRGGAAAAESCLLDRRFRACANLDGSVSSSVLSQRLEQPFLLMRSEVEELQLDGFFAQQAEHAYRVFIEGAGHNNFTDLPRLLDHWRQEGKSFDTSDLLIGTIAPERAVEISAAYLRSFFAAELSGAAPALLSAPSPYPEVQMTAVSEP